MMQKKASGAVLVLALFCFAANSLLCRQALSGGDADPATFTSLRLLAGAIVLSLIGRARKGSLARRSLPSAVALWVYAACFSFAYRELSAATGALVMFAAVQVTMLGGALLSGERPSATRLVGLVAALAGVGYLLAPGVESPSVAGAASMLVSGTAWGLYSLLGRGRGDATSATAGDFVLASGLAIALSVSRWETTAAALSPTGAALALGSGAFASGLGYALWFAALERLEPSAAAVVQLAVPVLAAAGGVVLLSEPVSPRLLFAGVIVLSGIALSLSAPSRTNRADTSGGAPEPRRGGSPRAARGREARASTS